jgi:hypothetical protein
MSAASIRRPRWEERWTSRTIRGALWATHPRRNLHPGMRYRHARRHLLLHGGHGRVEHGRSGRGHAGPAALLRHLRLVCMLLELLLVLLQGGLLLREELLMLRVLRVLLRVLLLLYTLLLLLLLLL